MNENVTCFPEFEIIFSPNQKAYAAKWLNTNTYINTYTSSISNFEFYIDTDLLDDTDGLNEFMIEHNTTDSSTLLSFSVYYGYGSGIGDLITIKSYNDFIYQLLEIDQELKIIANRCNRCILPDLWFNIVPTLSQQSINMVTINYEMSQIILNK